jgi:hypothetical protein
MSNNGRQREGLTTWYIDNVNVQDVLEKALSDLMGLCDVVIEKFEGAQAEYKAKNPASVQAQG